MNAGSVWEAFCNKLLPLPICERKPSNFQSLFVSAGENEGSVQKEVISDLKSENQFLSKEMWESI